MATKNKFINALLKSTGNELASVAKDGVIGGDVTHWVDTGSYSFNALLSGSMYKGLAANKITTLAGDPSTGKSYYALEIAKNLLNSDPNALATFFFSESDVGKELIEKRKLDSERVGAVPVATVEEFRTQAVKLLNAYKAAEDNKPKLMMVLDSMGNLSTIKETEDITAGDDKRDMTRAQLLRGAFRVLTLKMGVNNVPLILVNHVYNNTSGYGDKKKQSGGDGPEFAASQVVFLSKSQHKESDEQVGVVITCKLKKSRFTIEKREVDTLLRFDTGLDRYYGLLPLAHKFGIVKKVSTKYEFPNGKSAFETTIVKNPEAWFTKDVLDLIEAKCPGEFFYGTTNFMESKEEDATGSNKLKA